MTRPHTTHHESCGCCEAERDALKAEVAALRETNAKLNRCPHTTLPLDEAALDRLDGRRYPDKWTGDDESMLLAQSRAALALEAERDALMAQVERLREALVRKNMALRVLCEESRSYIEWSKQMPFERAIDEALAETTDMAALAERAPEVPR